MVLNTAASKRNNSPDDPNQFFALAIGVGIIAGGYAVGGISGGAFNPAVAIGLDVSSFGDGVQGCFAGTTAESMATVLAVVLFHTVRPGKE